MSPRANRSWWTLGMWAMLLAAGGGSVWWWLSLRATEEHIQRKRSGLTQLYLGGGLPPSQEVTDYLTARQTALEADYRAAIQLVAPTDLSAAQTDAQLHFQERVHAVQRTLERLATARGMKVPDQLGVPKELPPPDAVPRFLVQVALIEELAERIMPVQGLAHVSFFKVEDPQGVGPPDPERDAFLTRLPVRIHVSGSLEAVTTILGILDRARPLIELQSLRVVAQPTTQALDVELVAARYLVTTPLGVPHPEPASTATRDT